MRSYLFLLFLLLNLASCKKNPARHPCYDPTIVHNGACTTDCPGVTGCDGKFYCNECEAARNGIRKK